MKRISLIFVVSLAGLITARLAIPVRAQGQLTTRPNEMKVVELVRAVENGIVRVDEVGAVSVLDATTNTFVEKAVDTHAGTGFVIQCQSVGAMDLDVFIVTNDHVASDRAGVFRGERNLYVRPKFGRRQAVELVGVDALSDLAVLKVRVPIAAKDSWRAFAWSPNLPQVGEDVVAAGFPFPQVLQNGINITRGNVSAMGGIGGNTANMQMTAPVQPGNSGGPLFDSSGNIVGVVVARLNSQAVKSETQNINYAVQGPVARLFLESNGVSPTEVRSTRDVKMGDLSDAAREFTFQIVCFKAR